MVPNLFSGDIMREINRRRTLLAAMALTVLGGVAQA